MLVIKHRKHTFYLVLLSVASVVLICTATENRAIETVLTTSLINAIRGINRVQNFATTRKSTKNILNVQ